MAARGKSEDVMTVEVDGVTCSLRRDAMEDFDVVEASYQIADPDSTPSQRGAARIRMYRAILGDDYARVKSELRAAHGGTLKTGVMIDFMDALIRKVGELKN